MGFIKNMMVRNFTFQTLKELDDQIMGISGAISKSGVYINEETAMRFSTVYSCIRIISEDVGMIPVEIRRWKDVRDHSKGSDLAYDHPLYDVLFAEPNPEMTSMIFEETMQSHILSSGNCYAYKYLDGRGRTIKMQLLNWTKMTPKRNKETGEIEYEFNDRGKPETFEFNEIFHIPGLGFNGLVGYSPITMHADAIGLGIAAEQFANYFYSNGANVGSVITLPNAIQDKEGLRKEIKQKFGGLIRSHETMVLEQGAEFHRIDMPLADAEFIATRKYQDEKIASIYRMPLIMLQNADKLTYNNAEHQDLSYMKHTLLPWMVRWEQSIFTRALTKMERMQGLFARFKTNEMLRGDSKTMATVNHLKRQDGIIDTNEWRAMDDMNPRSEPEASQLIVNGNMRAISIVNSLDPVSGQQFQQDDGQGDGQTNQTGGEEGNA